MNALTGTWEGTFTYGEDYPQNIIGKSVSFQMKIEERDGDLKGSCEDDCLKEFPSKIVGFVDDDFVSFIKTYAYHIGFDEDGNNVSDPGNPAHEIHYSGTWDADSIEGVFEFGDNRIFARAESVYEGGTFIMKKQG